MTTATFQKRTSSASKNSQGYKNALILMTKGGKVYTCHTSGRGRFTTNLDYTADTINVLSSLKLVKGIDYVVGNDAPRGGKTGQFIELTARGRGKMIVNS